MAPAMLAFMVMLLFVFVASKSLPDPISLAISHESAYLVKATVKNTSKQQITIYTSGSVLDPSPFKKLDVVRSSGKVPLIYRGVQGQPAPPPGHNYTLNPSDNEFAEFNLEELYDLSGGIGPLPLASSPGGSYTFTISATGNMLGDYGGAPTMPAFTFKYHDSITLSFIGAGEGFIILGSAPDNATVQDGNSTNDSTGTEQKKRTSPDLQECTKFSRYRYQALNLAQTAAPLAIAAADNVTEQTDPIVDRYWNASDPISRKTIADHYSVIANLLGPIGANCTSPAPSSAILYCDDENVTVNCKNGSLALYSDAATGFVVAVSTRWDLFFISIVETEPRPQFLHTINKSRADPIGSRFFTNHNMSCSALASLAFHFSSLARQLLKPPPAP